MNTNFLREGERFDDLELECPHGRLMIIQHKDKYCFTTDSVLLSDFARIKKGETAADLGTGSGIIAVLLAAKTEAKHIYGIEIQKYMAEMAARTVEYNELSERISIANIRMQEAHKLIGYNCIDVVVTNPPYGKPDSGGVQLSEEIRIARHEIAVTLDEVIASAARVIKYGGRLYMIHRADRLADIICAMRSNNFEPKRIRYVASRADATPTHLLIEAHSYGKSGIITEPTLVLYSAEGEYTDESKRIYNK